MAKRKSKSPTKNLFVAGLLLIGFAVGGGYYLSKQTGDPYRTVEPLDSTVYLRDANGLRGNIYKIKGEVYEQLAWRTSGARLISVREMNTKKEPSESEIIPLLLPSALKDSQLQKGQIFHFRVEVREGGVLTVVSLAKA